jgi:MoaA/NifB/PqqE/SkfB family radical SAM enzyme
MTGIRPLIPDRVPGRIDYRALFDRQIREVFKDALRACLRHPALALFFARTVTAQRRAARRRELWLQQGLPVPPLLIASITNRCNLQCTNCYARTQHWRAEQEMPMDRWQTLLGEARELGIGLVMLAGGEPLTRPEALDLTRNFPDIVFPLFTNGLLMTPGIISELKRQRHVIPVLSLEGFELETDTRRGAGVYERVHQAIRRLEGSDIFFGVSLTVSRRNFPVLTHSAFLNMLYNSGSRLFIFVEFTPVAEGTEELCLTRDQKRQLEEVKVEFRQRRTGVVIGFPGDEEQYGGCLAAGRGFIHVSPDGALEACPFAPWSDTTVSSASLKEALQSRLLARIREGHDRLKETTGGCALWRNQDWVRSLLPDPGLNRPGATAEASQA